jgi:DNA-binding MarR family transcriptional regulator
MQLPDKKARLNLNRFLPYRLTTLSNKMSHELTELYSSKFGLSIQEWQILMVLGEHEELLAVEICSLTAMYKVAVSRAVKKLLSKNLLLKNQSEEDNRRFTLSLSDQGKTLYAKVGPIAVNYEAEIIASLSATEIEEMDALFTKLDGILEGIELG